MSRNPAAPFERSLTRATLVDGSARCWGYNAFGLPPDNRASDRASMDGATLE